MELITPTNQGCTWIIFIKYWVYSLHMTGTTTITPPATTITMMTVNDSGRTGNRNLACLLTGFPTWHWLWFRNQRKENLFRERLPEGAGQNVSGPSYTGADFLQTWPPGSLNLANVAGMPFSPSAMARPLPRCTITLHLTSVKSGAQAGGLQAVKINISSLESKDTGSGLISNHVPSLITSKGH